MNSQQKATSLVRHVSAPHSLLSAHPVPYCPLLLSPGLPTTCRNEPVEIQNQTHADRIGLILGLYQRIMACILGWLVNKQLFYMDTLVVWSLK